MDQGVVCPLHGELVGRTDEGQTRLTGDLGRFRFGEARRRIDAGADGRTSQRQAVHIR
jgi:hypothetical protein